MAAVSEMIVREFFEVRGFLVRQHRKHVAPLKKEEEDIDFYIYNPRPKAQAAPLPFILNPKDLSGVTRAIVVVKGWHTETFSRAVLANAPEIFRFVEAGVFQNAARAFGDGLPLLRILIVPALPTGKGAREQSIRLLQEKGIDGVIPFRVILVDLINEVEVNRNYQKSDLLQTIRLLKNYDLVRDAQLELFRGRPRRKRTSARENGPAKE